MSWESDIPRVYDATVDHHESPIHCDLIPSPIEPRNTLPGSVGADVIFLGRTRPEEHPEFGRLTALEYEAHETMAPRIMREICDELLSEFGLTHISMVHATGRVAIGEASVRLHISAEHRAEAFAAVAAGMDRLKARVPIWKCERWEDGRSWSRGTAIADVKGVS